MNHFARSVHVGDDASENNKPTAPPMVVAGNPEATPIGYDVWTPSPDLFGPGAMSFEVWCRAERATFTLDVSSLRSQATLLLSIIQELSRIRTTSAVFRFVEEDTMRAGKYMSKKGNIVQMPAPVLHRRLSLRSNSATSVDPERFVPFQKGEAKINPTSYRAFGGGSSLRPERFFATAETLMLVSLMVLTSDIKLVTGQWDESLVNESVVTSSYRQHEASLLSSQSERDCLTPFGS
ncbi:MAG: hypothetical protein Q9159_006380 [Coniocarpon cinnabarinum]